jgi:hypothetical protein
LLLALALQQSARFFLFIYTGIKKPTITASVRGAFFALQRTKPGPNISKTVGTSHSWRHFRQNPLPPMLSGL